MARLSTRRELFPSVRRPTPSSRRISGYDSNRSVFRSLNLQGCLSRSRFLKTERRAATSKCGFDEDTNSGPDGLVAEDLVVYFDVMGRRAVRFFWFLYRPRRGAHVISFTNALFCRVALLRTGVHAVERNEPLATVPRLPNRDWREVSNESKPRYTSSRFQEYGA